MFYLMNKYYEFIILGTLLNNLFNKKYIFLLKKFLFINIFNNFLYLFFIFIYNKYKKISLDIIVLELNLSYFFGINIDCIFFNDLIIYNLDIKNFSKIINIYNYKSLILKIKIRLIIYYSNLYFFLGMGYIYMLDLFKSYISSFFNIVIRNNFIINKYICLKKVLLTILGVNKLLIANTGVYGLDFYIKGLTIGDLIIIAGRPSIGKTTFSICIASYLFINLGIPVLFFSMEMSMFQILFKFLMIIINDSSIKYNYIFNYNKKKKILLASLLLKTNIIKIIDFNISSLSNLELIIRDWVFSNKSNGVIFIDYLQLLCFNDALNRTIEISIISRELKIIAKKYCVVIIALSQMNRNIELSSDRLPILSDLRDSGSIEQDADIIIFIHKNILFNTFNTKYLVMDLIIAKNRNGNIGISKLFYNKLTTRFYSYK